MYADERYTLYRIANDLVERQGFTVLYLNKKSELWLEKKVNGTLHVVRMYHHTFDWKNQLQNDIEIVIQKVKSLRKILLGNSIKIHNVYVATYPPVDSWEELKKPIQVNFKRHTDLFVYYLDQENQETELNRLYQALGLTYPTFSYPDSEIDMEQMSFFIEQKLVSIYKNQVAEDQKLFSRGRPLLTYIFIFINILFYMFIEQNGGSTDSSTLIRYGAKYNLAILNGEWWRLFSSMFIHIGFAHLLMNMLALYFVGSAVERLFGNVRFLMIYLLAGLIGGLASFAFNSQLAAGASGAIFGLFGALLFFGLNYKRVFFQTMGWNIIIVIAINIVFGLLVPQIDNGAHLGGLIGGFIASGVVFFPQKKKIITQGLSSLVYLVLLISLVWIGTNTSINRSSAVQVHTAQELMQEERYVEVIEITTDGLEYADDYTAELLFFRSFSWIQLNQMQKAENDLQQLITIDSSMPEAHYNLAIIYADQGEMMRALEQIEKAYELDPNNKDIYELYNQLSGGE